MQFPHLNDTNFPNVGNVDVYQYENDFDYSRYNATQMRVTICAVPWDMGEAHIGNRTISGIGNVVYFESKEKRDAWFAAIPDSECFRFETKYKALHRDLQIDVPLPFDIAARYNYVMVEYNLFANDGSPVMYESKDGVRKWFWFIREVEYLAPNSTRLHILDDAFQTWIYDVDITGMILERGHAPMYETDVAKYLKNPIAECSSLTTEDVNYGTLDVARSQSAFVFNSKNMYALIVTTANPSGTWGTKAGGTWKTPGNWNVTQQGVPAYYVFAVTTANLSSLLSYIASDVPQFAQTIKAIAFVSSDLVTLGMSFTFGSITCYPVGATYKQNTLIELDKSQFGYDEKYSNITKLYTYPYSHIVITDENGTQTEIRVENTNGTLQIESCVNLVFPWLKIDATLSGIGASARSTINFANVTARNMPVQGNWYEYVYEWRIPTFGLYQDASANNDYATHYDRAQQQTAATNEQTSANASATTAQANAQETADTAVDNADIAADTNTAITTISNASALADSTITQSFNSYMVGVDNTITSSSASSTIQAADQQAALAASVTGMSAAVSAAGAVGRGDYAGALTSVAGGIIGAHSTVASTAIGNALTAVNASNTILGNQQHATAANTKTADSATNQTSAQSDIADAQNDMTTGTAANSSACTYANAARDYATDTANATRRYNTATSAISNQIAQAAISAPVEFGAWNAGETATDKPQGLFANIVTQDDGAIARAGDEMLRYGYMYDRQWPFDGNWNVCKHFTYWKLRDFWVKGLNVPDMYMDKLRFFLYGGVTVWRTPEDIGNYTIYQNL